MICIQTLFLGLYCGSTMLFNQTIIIVRPEITFSMMYTCMVRLWWDDLKSHSPWCTHVCSDYGRTWNYILHDAHMYALTMVRPEITFSMMHTCMLRLWWDLKSHSPWCTHVCSDYGETWNHILHDAHMYAPTMVRPGITFSMMHTCMLWLW